MAVDLEAAAVYAPKPVGAEDLRADDDPIVALATPWGESALAVIRACGRESVERAALLFRGRRPLEQTPGHALARGRIVDPSTNEPIDDVLVAVFRAPRSYTGQDAVEISCHGGPAVISRILALLLASGFRQAGPGEFTLRAFLNGHMDLTRAEAVNEIIRARSDRARSLAYSRLSGAVEARVNAAKQGVLHLLAALEIRLDYPEEELDDEAPGPAEARRVREDIARLLETYAAGRLIQEGAVLAIAGRANAGKSTLFNLLLREDRSIVDESPGTTRDYVEGAISIDGYGFRLFDTAGLREPQGGVEQEGIRRARRVVRDAHLVLYLVDGAVGVHEEDVAVLRSVQDSRLVRIWSKADRATAAPPAGFLACSGRTGAGLEGVHAAILARLRDIIGGGQEEPIIDSARQKASLERARDALDRSAAALEASLPLDVVAVEVREALEALGEITGRVSSADVLRAMFATFCVGK